MAAIRTFIAIETPESVRRAIIGVQNELRKSNADVRWEGEEKLHATVKFLGNVEEKILPSVLERIRTVAGESDRCTVVFETVGFFPDKRHPRVVWMGCTNPDGKLEKLKIMLDKELRPFGFEIESRSFRPHITLGRIKSEKRILHLISISEKVTFEPRSSVVAEIVAMKSVLQTGGSKYSLLQKFQLKPE